jgi:hypothetical protein
VRVDSISAEVVLPTYFTKEQAERLLPQIRPLMEEVQQRKLLFDELQSQAEAIEGRLKGNGHGLAAQLGEKHEALREVGRTIATTVQRVQELGVEVKDLDSGLVDFRSLREGREVYLCWRVGEAAIDWWHTVDSGFAGRQRL